MKWRHGFLAGLLLASAGAVADDATIEDFTGSWRGVELQSSGADDGLDFTPQDLDIQIRSAGGGFHLSWTGLEILEVTGSETMPMTGIPSSWSYLGVVIGFVLLGVTSLTTLYQAVSASCNPLKIRTAPPEIIEGSAA